MHNNTTNQITDISTMQFICTLHNFMQITSMQSNGTTISQSGFGSGWICQQISDPIPFLPDFKTLNLVHPYIYKIRRKTINR